VAADCLLDASATDALLGALTSIGLARRGADGRYAVGFESVGVLDRLLALWDGLDQTLVTGAPVLSVGEPAVAGPVYAELARFVSSFEGPSARAVQLLAAPNRTVLDVGAGTAKWSRALLAAEPSMRATALDLAEVVHVTRQAVAHDGLAERFDFVAGDLFRAKAGGPFDLAIVAGVCHLFEGVAVRRLLTRAVHWLLPRGELVLAQPFPADDVQGAFYALGLRLRTTGGGLHPFSSYAAWLIDAGFERVELLEADPPMTLIRARRAQ